MKTNFGEFEVEIVEVYPGLSVISGLAHPIVFEDGEVLEPNPEMARLIKASMEEKVFGHVGDAVLVQATPKPDMGSLKVLRKFEQENPGVRVVSSIIGVTAFRNVLPGLVISPVTTPETTRKPNSEKRCFRHKWSC